MKRTRMLLVGAMLLWAPACTEAQTDVYDCMVRPWWFFVGRHYDATDYTPPSWWIWGLGNPFSMPASPLTAQTDTLDIISASLSASTGSLIAAPANWDSTPEPAPVLLNMTVDLAAQRIECGDAVRNSVQQFRDAVPQLLPGCGEAASIPPILNFVLYRGPDVVW